MLLLLIKTWVNIPFVWIPINQKFSPSFFLEENTLISDYQQALQVAIKFARAYIYDFLCIAKASLEDHLDKLKMVYTRLKSSLSVIEMEYLWYILPHTGIKLQLKKVKQYFPLNPHNKSKTSANSWALIEIFEKDSVTC